MNCAHGRRRNAIVSSERFEIFGRIVRLTRLVVATIFRVPLKTPLQTAQDVVAAAREIDDLMREVEVVHSMVCWFTLVLLFVLLTLAHSPGMKRNAHSTSCTISQQLIKQQ
jgi:hypothetical protein